ncbi:MAG: argininosuccinate lyase [Candidatus Poribacteria bacterium]|nr:argininosuccinate lyase [Candidatus Poribacteria bacterium]
MMGPRGHATAQDAVIAYTESTAIDARMLLHDIWGSEAHALMLGKQGILSDDDLRHILQPLQTARADAGSGALTLDRALEDVHMNVESYIIRAVGREYGGKLHTARSRNDQVITDARLYIRELLLDIETATVTMIEAFLRVAEDHAETVLPGYTHTQHAQPITLGFWATAHASLLLEDLRRLRAAYDTTNRNPLGACALAGTSFDTDRELTTRLLAFDATQDHALAVVSGRDFILESAFALATVMTNLSRFSEEVILWTTHEFGMMTLDDAYALGSSIMPQKKNPDIAELARGRTAKIQARLAEAFSMMKALPLGYHRDLQEDKPLLWEGFDIVADSLNLLTQVIQTSTFRTKRMLDLTYGNFCTATELANYLVAEDDVPFRASHEVTGALVAHLVERGETFRDIDACVHFLATKGYAISVDTLTELFDPVASVRRNQSQGGTSPQSVRKMASALADAAASHRGSVAIRSNAIRSARDETARCVRLVLEGKAVLDVV